MLLLLSIFFARIFAGASPVLENECEFYDETSCRNSGCNWVVEEGEPECVFELDPELDPEDGIVSNGGTMQTEESAEAQEEMAEESAEAQEDGIVSNGGTMQTEESAEAQEEMAEESAEAQEDGVVSNGGTMQTEDQIEANAESTEDQAEANAEIAEDQAESGVPPLLKKQHQVVEVECELWVGDQATCTTNGCNYSVDEEGEPSCTEELETEVEAETDCELYIADETTCTTNGCIWAVDEEGERSCTLEADPETEGGEMAEETAEDQAEAQEEAADPSEAAEASAELAEEQNEALYDPEVEAGEAAEDPAETAEETAEAQAEAAEDAVDVGVVTLKKTHQTGTVVVEVECELYVLDQSACEGNSACVYIVDEEGEASCEEKDLEAGEVAEAEIDCELYIADETTCTSNNCIWAVDEEGERSCTLEADPETDAGEIAEEQAEAAADPSEAAEEAAELAEEQNEAQYDPETGAEPNEVAEEAAEVAEEQNEAQYDPEVEAGEVAEPGEAAEEAAELAEEQTEAQYDVGVTTLQKARINYCDCSPSTCQHCGGQWEVDPEDNEADCKGGNPPMGEPLTVTECTGDAESELDAEDTLEGELPDPEDTIPEVDTEYMEVEPVEPEDTIPESGMLRKPHTKQAGKQTDVGPWFLLGCTFLISAIFSVWCVTKTVEYFDRREYGIDLDTLTEDFNYESLA